MSLGPESSPLTSGVGSDKAMDPRLLTLWIKAFLLTFFINFSENYSFILTNKNMYLSGWYQERVQYDVVKGELFYFNLITIKEAEKAGVSPLRL